MTIVYDKFGIQVHQGDCLDVIRTLPEASVSAVITDPPYGLSELSTKRVVSALTRWLGDDREFIPSGPSGFMGNSWDTFVPPPAVWDECYRVLKPGGHLLSFAGTRTMDLMGLSIRLSGFEYRDSIGSPILAWMYGQGFPKSKGQLKPAWEPIIMVRKPFSGTVIGNLLEWGVGGLNVDACRIAGEPWSFTHTAKTGRSAGVMGNVVPRSGVDQSHDNGRWPANLVLSHARTPDGFDACADGCGEDCPIAVLDVQSGELSSGSRKQGSHALMGYMGADVAPMPEIVGDGGGASRFFPCFRWEAKAPTVQRPRVNGKSWSTVKPLELMRWLARLVTPPGGVILDCFAGTGTTGQAARAEGFPAVLIEQDPDAISMIRARLDAKPKTEAATAARPVEDAPQDLFDLLGDAS